MKRFFFNLCAARDVEDRWGIRFETELQAFRAAQRFARDLAEVRPALCEKAWISLTCEGSYATYCVGIPCAAEIGPPQI
jgi:hypothetical protein